MAFTASLWLLHISRAHLVCYVFCAHQWGLWGSKPSCGDRRPSPALLRWVGHFLPADFGFSNKREPEEFLPPPREAKSPNIEGGASGSSASCPSCPPGRWVWAVPGSTHPGACVLPWLTRSPLTRPGPPARSPRPPAPGMCPRLPSLQEEGGSWLPQVAVCT